MCPMIIMMRFSPSTFGVMVAIALGVLREGQEGMWVSFTGFEWMLRKDAGSSGVLDVLFITHDLLGLDRGLDLGHNEGAQQPWGMGNPGNIQEFHPIDRGRDMG